MYPFVVSIAISISFPWAFSSFASNIFTGKLALLASNQNSKIRFCVIVVSWSLSGGLFIANPILFQVRTEKYCSQLHRLGQLFNFSVNSIIFLGVIMKFMITKFNL